MTATNNHNADIASDRAVLSFMKVILTLKKMVLCIFRRVSPEMLVWAAVLCFPLLIDPYVQGHISLCPFKAVGIDFCPGCGLGRSMALLYRGDLAESLRVHPMGIVALAILIYRIAVLACQIRIYRE
jgi:hypothetical protein